MTTTMAAARLRVTGLVQGVGFRPFVHRSAARHGLAGWVRNTSELVEIHVEGDESAIDSFVDALRREPPVLALIESIDRRSVACTGAVHFAVEASATTSDGRQPVSPDVATCDACLREMNDPADRRYRYAFITCTDCGPRFTVIEAMPYDRQRTSMKAFAQCPSCSTEYAAPGDRRYHSETNSCPVCGPRLWFRRLDDCGPVPTGYDAVLAAATVLRNGGIVAIRGLGGFHLATDATNEEAVQRLRTRKQREAKPLAVMVRDISAAGRVGSVGEMEHRSLTSAQRPIVLLPIGTQHARGGTDERAATQWIAPSVAPGLAHIGVMIAYTPLHHLLLEAVDRPLVMTSGNLTDEPIATGNDEALIRLGDIADAWLLHDRDIVARYDDSVIRVVHGAPVFLRRARGYAPLPIDIPIESTRPLLAVGPHLKNTFTLLSGRRAHVSQHIGDLENLETVEHFTASLRKFEALFRIRPEGVVRDLHPGYLSTRLALDSGLPMIAAVQHHHAHVAAVMAEHGRVEPVIGVAYDGTGYGDDGATWGAELLHADLSAYRRLAHLRYAPLPGGDAAARAPWRSAMGYLAAVPEAGETLRRVTSGIDSLLVGLVARQLERQVNAPPASSMGRLFDAAAAVLAVRSVSRFEGDAAMALEALAGDLPGVILPFCITRKPDGVRELDAVPLLVTLGERLLLGEAPASLAASFHDTVVHATAELVRHAVEDTGCDTVVLAGGCFQNARLLAGLGRRLERDGHTVLLPRRLGPNDGAVSLGQAAIGAAVLTGLPSAVPTGIMATAEGG
ncbi:MAG TPA: carbamoyltransferase HypF [Gemmatimonadaceae bacterium]